jgi:hypothetical protein
MQSKNSAYKGSVTDPDDMMSVSSKTYSGSVSTYATANTDDSLSKKCLVCKKNFILRRKITCQICLSVFCSDHCTRKRHLPEYEDMVSVCDTCDREETKKEIEEEIAIEIQKFSQELKDIKENNEKLFKDHFSKTGAVNEIEMEITKQEWNHRKQEQELLTQLELEQNRGNKLRIQTDQLRTTLDELNTSERYMSDQCCETESELEDLKGQVNSLQSQKEELESQIDKINKSLRESLGIDEVRKILCQKCLFIVNENLRRGRVSEDVVESIKEYHRESIVATDENNKKKCEIF